MGRKDKSTEEQQQQQHHHGEKSSLSSSTSSLFSALSVAPSACSVSTVSTASTRCSVSTTSSYASASSSTSSSSFRSTQSAPPQHFSNSYELVGQVGDKGAYSTVWEARHKDTGDRVAVKIMRRSKLSALDDAAVFEEVEILRFLNRESEKRRVTRHRAGTVAADVSFPDEYDGVLRVIDFFVTPNTFYIVTELMECGDMFDQIVQRGRFSEDETKGVVHSVLRSLAYLHEKGVAHRDIKPENLLLCKLEEKKANKRSSASSSSRKQRARDMLDMQVVKLADFGLAARVKKPRSLIEGCGTPMYVAPEVLRGVPYDQSCDLWSVGVILFFLLSGYPPFMDNKKRGLYFKIISGSFSFDGEGWEAISDEAKDLITRLLTVDPSTRISAEQALKHDWIRSGK